MGMNFVIEMQMGPAPLDARAERTDMKSMVMQRFIMPALLALLAWPAMAQPAKETNTASAVKPKQINRGDLAGNMQLLNLWGDRPETIQRLYEAAYKALASRPDATFADLARDTTVQRLCAEAGVTHLGGPMLGGIRPDGAAVWLRTLRPARIEVRVAVDGREQVFGPVESTEQGDLSAVVGVTGLRPDTRYPYRVLIDGKPINSATGGG